MAPHVSDDESYLNAKIKLICILCGHCLNLTEEGENKLQEIHKIQRMRQEALQGILDDIYKNFPELKNKEVLG